MPVGATLPTLPQASTVHPAGVTAKGPAPASANDPAPAYGPASANGPAPASANGPARVPNAEPPFSSTVYIHLCRK